MRAFIIIFLALMTLSWLSKCDRKKSYSVGVGRSSVSAKIDLTDQLDPRILPDVLEKVLASIPVDGKPEKAKFQQQVVTKFSQAVMDDPEVNYRVDLNEDGTIDPLLIVPENVESEGAVYSLRVPDPGDYPSDPGSDSDWERIAEKQSIELVEVGVTFDKNSKQVSVSSSPNGHVYENSGQNAHYTQHYPHRHHSWIETYFQYRLFSMMLFGPYGGFGGYYGGMYGAGYRPYPTASRARSVSSSKFSKAPKGGKGLKTASGKSLKGSRSASGRKMPSSIKKIKSKRAMAVRKQKFASRRGGFGSRKTTAVGSRRSGGFGRSRSSGFGGGGSRGWGK